MTADYIATLAYNALIAEVETTPKPGLVDRNNNGAHSDMCFEHFILSAKAIKPYLEKMCLARNDELKDIGLAAENAMFSATGGVNTHKGAIYSLGLLCTSAYRLQSVDVDGICSYAAELSRELNGNAVYGNTHGLKVFCLYGVKGVRGEAESGFKSVIEYGLPVYESYIFKNGLQIAAVKTLLSLMANVRDTNVISRGGLDGEKYVMKRAAEVFNVFSIDNVLKFDQELIERNLSPGGCADLLAVTIFLYNLKKGA